MGGSSPWSSELIERRLPAGKSAVHEVAEWHVAIGAGLPRQPQHSLLKRAGAART